MWNLPSKEKLNEIPKLYATDFIPVKDKLIYMHFFIGSCDWFVAEYDGDDRFFGYVVLHDDYLNSEWGYFLLSSLKSFQVGGLEIDYDLYWKIRPASEIERIKL